MDFTTIMPLLLSVMSGRKPDLAQMMNLFHPASPPPPAPPSEENAAQNAGLGVGEKKNAGPDMNLFMNLLSAMQKNQNASPLESQQSPYSKYADNPEYRPSQSSPVPPAMIDILMRMASKNKQ